MILAKIRREDTNMRRRTGRLNRQNLAYIQGRLNTLAMQVNADIRQERREDRRDGDRRN